MGTARTNNGSDATRPGGDEAVALTAYEAFVLRHTHPLNLWVHVVSFVMFWGGPLAALALWSPWPLLAFVLSGPMGAFGHFISGDSDVNLRETTSSPQVVWFSSTICLKFLRGTYQADIDRAREKFARLEA